LAEFESIDGLPPVSAVKHEVTPCGVQPLSLSLPLLSPAAYCARLNLSCWHKGPWIPLVFFLFFFLLFLHLLFDKADSPFVFFLLLFLLFFRPMPRQLFSNYCHFL